MADWIKMRVNLDTDPRVIEMAQELELSELHVVGLLWKVWSWADQHSLDGNALRVTEETLDRFTSTPGFSRCLRNVAWLEGRNGSLSFPRFAEHNGQTAKNRAVTKKRVDRHRNGVDVSSVTEGPLPEEKRRDSNKEKVPPAGADDPPCTVAQAIDYAPMCRMTPAGATHWWHTRNASGWTKSSASGGPSRRITSWKSDMATSHAWAEEGATKTPKTGGKAATAGSGYNETSSID